MSTARGPRPYVTLKLATSLDGRIAAASGESRWITGPEARAIVHGMRAAHDAVVVGIGTALADDPELTARTDPAPQKQPVRIVIDSRGRLPTDGKLAQSARRGGVMVYTAAGAQPDKRAALEALGVDVRVMGGVDGRVDLTQALADMQSGGLYRVLVEGGGQLAASLIDAGLVDHLEWMRAPIILGARGISAIAALNDERLSAAPRWRRVNARAIGGDLWESYEVF